MSVRHSEVSLYTTCGILAMIAGTYILGFEIIDSDSYNLNVS